MDVDGRRWIAGLIAMYPLLRNGSVIVDYELFCNDAIQFFGDFDHCFSFNSLKVYDSFD